MTDPVDHTETLLGTAAPHAAPSPRADGGLPRVLGSRYLLEERIASGGMASVWRAHDEVLARTVAIKVLHDHLAADDGFRERFRREAIAAAKLTHPNVVGLYDTGTDGRHVYLVMEFVDGVTLKQVIATQGRLEVGRAATIAEKVARALNYAHDRGLVHRDVKPANILIGADGAVKVADFGIAKAEEGDDLTKTGMVLGTAAYVAPEQILAEPIDGKADQYALACVLYETLTGRQPFRADSAVATAAQRLESEPLPVRARRPDVPRAIDEVVMCGLSRRPEDRFPTLGRFADALAPFADVDEAETAALAVAASVPRTGPRPVGDLDGEDTGDLAGELSFDTSAPFHPSGATAAPLLLPSPDGHPAPDGHRAPGRRGESFLGSEGRWLAVVLVLLLLVGALVAVGFATGVLDPQRIPILSAQDGGAPAEEEDGDAEPVPLGIAGIAAFDPPPGDGDESDAELPRAIDGDPSTAWQSEGYDTPAFGNLKDGVGFFVDLGATRPVSAVRLTTPTPGVGYEIRVASQGPPSELDGWEPVASVSDAQPTTTATFETVTARYVLVWFTGELQPDGARHRAAVAELSVLGTAPDGTP